MPLPSPERPRAHRLGNKVAPRTGNGRGKREGVLPGVPVPRLRAAPMRAWKERDANWTLPEMLELVHAKKEEWLEDIEVEDGRDLMNPETTRWRQISTKVNRNKALGAPDRDGSMCKYKWTALL